MHFPTLGTIAFIRAVVAKVSKCLTLLLLIEFMSEPVPMGSGLFGAVKKKKDGS